jgi:hypothetical protein
MYQWTEDAVKRTESPSSDCSHLSSSSSDVIETFVQNRFIDSELMSSASGGDWSDNDFEEADEPDVGDMLPTLTEVGFV